MEFLLLIITIVSGILFYFFKDKISIFLQGGEVKLPFKRKDFLLNIPERKFFEWLQQIIPADYIVFPQILLSTIVNVKSSRKEFWIYQNKINRKTIDFVIFEKQYLKPVIAVEYDGKTHSRRDRQKRDIFVNKVLELAEIKSIHVEHRKNIDFDEMENRISELLTRTRSY